MLNEREMYKTNYIDKSKYITVLKIFIAAQMLLCSYIFHIQLQLKAAELITAEKININ